MPWDGDKVRRATAVAEMKVAANATSASWDCGWVEQGRGF
jgi:hypothetical protein